MIIWARYHPRSEHWYPSPWNGLVPILSRTCARSREQARLLAQIDMNEGSSYTGDGGRVMKLNLERVP